MAACLNAIIEKLLFTCILIKNGFGLELVLGVVCFGDGGVDFFIKLSNSCLRLIL